MIIKIKNLITNHFNLFVFIMLTIVIFSLYGKSLFFDFTYYDDDVLVLDRQDYLSFSNIRNIFSNTVFGVETDKYCRPILNLTFLCEKYLYGTQPFGYHFTNVVIHLFSVFSVYLFLSLFYDRKKTLIFCSLFACHPAIVQAVAWIPGRNDSLLTLFVVLSFYFFIKYINFSKSNYLFGYLVCFVLSLLTKETAIFVPIFYFLLLIYREKNIKRNVICIMIWLLITIIYLFYRTYVLNYQSYSLTFTELLNNFIISFPTITKYIANIFFPIKLSVFPSILSVNYLLAITSFLITILFFLKFKFYDLKFILFGFLWFFVFLFPTFLITNNQFFDHRIYLPLVGMLFVVLELTKAYNDLFSKKFMAIVFCIFLLFFTITIFYEQKFENKKIFWLNDLESSPQSDIPHAMIGCLLSDSGFYKEAEQQILEAIAIKEDPTHYVNLSVLYASMGNLQKMEEALLKSLTLSKDNPKIYYNLALLYKYKGEIEKAKEMKDLYLKVFKDTNKIEEPKEIIL